MAYYQDLREYLAALEEKGKLFRLSQELVKETDLTPLLFLQYRGLPEDQRRAFLFEKVVSVTGRQYPNRVLMGCPASRDILAAGLMCTPEEIKKKWAHACAHPIEPVIVPTGPVHDVVIEGEELERSGLEGIGVPVEVPGFSGAVRVTTQVVTKDPETGQRNVGDYSGHFAGRTELRLSMAPGRHGTLHRIKWSRLGKAMPVAIVVGATPNIVLASSTPVPYDLDEYALAGGLAGEPVKLVKCRTSDLEVPATAEMVIEGEMTNVMEGHAAFGDYPGYLYEVSGRYVPIMRVKCITHRRDPIFHAFDIGYPPTATTVQESMSFELALYTHLTQSHMTGVLDVASHYAGGARNYVVVQIKKVSPWDPWQVLHSLVGYEAAVGKWSIVVDEDINPRDPEAVNWALSFRVQPHKDIRVITHRNPLLDPSAYPPHSPDAERDFPSPSGASAVLIDATRKWAYPPVGLPKQEYMEKALDLWERQGLPKLHLKEPWHGYHLGFWREEDEQNAQQILAGEYIQLWDRLNQKRRPMTGPFQ